MLDLAGVIKEAFLKEAINVRLPGGATVNVPGGMIPPQLRQPSPRPQLRVRKRQLRTHPVNKILKQRLHALRRGMSQQERAIAALTEKSTRQQGELSRQYARGRQLTEQIEKLKPKTFGQKFRAGLPKMLIGAGIATGLWGGKKLVSSIRRKYESKQNFSRMMVATPSLQREPPGIVESRFRTLQKMAPTLARDPLVAGSIVRQWVEYPTVSAAALKDVVSVERDLRGEPGFLPALSRIAGAIPGTGD